MTVAHHNERVAVTGARGYLGSALVAAFTRAGYPVVSLGRQMPGSSTYFSLGEKVDPTLLRGVSVLIHAAHDFTLTEPHDIRRVNVEGARKLFNAAIAAGVRKIIFISSVSSFATSTQLYGQSKYDVERMARGIGAYVVRPGIIYDDTMERGLLSKLGMLARLPIIPLFNGGNQPVLTSHLDDLTALMLALVNSNERIPHAPITAAFPKTMTFKSLLVELARRQKKHPHFVPMPSWLPFLLLRMLELLGFKPPFRSDAFTGIVKTDPSPDFSLTDAYGIAWRAFNVDPTTDRT